MTALELIDCLHVVSGGKEKAQSLFRKLGILKCYLRLLNDVYCSNSPPHSKSIASLIDLFSPNRAYSLLSFFARIARFCSLLVTSQVPGDWNQKLEKKVDDEKAVKAIGSAAGKNEKYVFNLLQDIPMIVSFFFCGILRTICHRRVLSKSSPKISQVMINQLATDAVESFKLLDTNTQDPHSSLMDESKKEELIIISRILLKYPLLSAESLYRKIGKLFLNNFI
jgi:hypothetical protein